MLRHLSVRNGIVGVALLAALWLAFGPFATGHPQMAHASAVIVLTLVLWSTGTFPPFLTGLLFFALVLVFKLASPELIFSGLGSTAVWLIISGFVIGAAITSSGLGRRLAGFLEPLLAASYARIITGLVIAAVLLGFVMPSSVGRAVVLVPVGMALAERVGFKPGSNGRIGIAAALALACNVPAFAILPANIPNMILAGAGQTLHGVSIGYLSYLILHFPVVGILKTVLIIALVRWIFPDKVHGTAEVHAAEVSPAKASAEAGAQRKVGVILTITLALWVTDSIHGINPAWVGLAAAVVLLLPGFGVVSPKAFNASIDFGVVVFVSAALGLGALVNQSGLGQLVGLGLQKILPLAPGHSALNFMSLSAMSALTGIVTTIPGVPTVLTPLAPGLAQASGMSLIAVLMTQVVGFSTVFFPYQVGPLVVGMQLSGERLGHLMKITLPLALASFVLLMPLDYLWWRLLGWI